MILQADITHPGMILVGKAKLMFCPVGASVWFRELIQVDVIYVLAIEHDVDQLRSHVISMWFHWGTGFMAFLVGLGRS